MNIHKKRIGGIVGVSSVCGLLAGCVAFGDVAPQAYEIGQSVGTSSNQAILLNIARAAHNEPLYFTQISQVGGSGTADLKTGLPNIVVGAAPTGAAGQLTFTNAADNSQSTNFQVGVLNSQDFYKQLLAPLDLVEVNLLLRSFPRELVFPLVVDKARATTGGQVTEIKNDLSDPAFSQDLEAAITYGLTTETYTEPNPDYTPPAQHGDTAGGGAQLPKNITVGRLCFDETVAAPTGKEFARTSAAACTYQAPKSKGKEAAARELVLPLNGRPTTVDISLRSPYQIFQYLGWVVAKSQPPQVKLDEQTTEPLLQVVSTSSPCFVSALYEGSKYCVPTSGADATKEIFSIINQILALNTETTALPATTTVQLVQ